MGTLIITTVLGLSIMILDMLKLRKIIAGFSATVLIILSVYNIAAYWGVDSSHFSDMLVVNKFSVAFSSLLLLLTGLIILLADKFFEREEHKISDYVSLFIFALIGALMMVSYGNMATLFIGIEILSISQYVLAASNRKSMASNEAGMKYFLIGAFMTGFLLMGITLIYGVSGSFNIQEIQTALVMKPFSPLLIVGVLAIMSAMLFKASVAPFHFWAPDVYTGAPSLVTTFMITVAKVAAFGAIYKLFGEALITKIPEVEPIIVFFILLTFVISNFSGLWQTSVKRIMAFSGVSHAGFLLLAIVASNFVSAGNLFYYGAGYAIANITIFTVIIYVSNIKGNDNVDSFKGLLYTKPALAIAFIIATLSLAGIPPLAGFFGKYLVLLSTIQAQYTYVAIIAIVVSIVSVFYYFKVLIAMTQRPDAEVVWVSPPLVYSAVAWIGVIALIVLGVVPKYFTGLF